MELFQFEIDSEGGVDQKEYNREIFRTLNLMLVDYKVYQRSVFMDCCFKTMTMAFITFAIDTPV